MAALNVWSYGNIDVQRSNVNKPFFFFFCGFTCVLEQSYPLELSAQTATFWIYAVRDVSHEMQGATEHLKMWPVGLRDRI